MKQPGEKVSIDHPRFPGVWVVDRIGPKNTVVKREGGGQAVRVPHYLLTDPTGDTIPSRDERFYDPGNLVRILAGKYAGLYVVVKDNGGDMVNVAKLGGDGGRYVRAMRRGLQPVDPAEVLIDPAVGA